MIKWIIAAAAALFGGLFFLRSRKDGPAPTEEEQGELQDEKERLSQPSAEEEKVHEELEEVDKEIKNQDDADRAEDADSAMSWLNDRFGGSG